MNLPFHPRAWLDSLFTYPRFLGRIRPRLLNGMEKEVEARLSALRAAGEPAVLKAPAGKRILALSAHPDDETIGAGGFLLAHRGKAEIRLMCLFNGEGGGRLERAPWSGDAAYREELAAERLQEFEAVAARLGAPKPLSFGLRDGLGSPTPELAARLRAAVLEARPDVVLLPWFLDDQRDHRAANALYAWACADLDCVVLGYEIWKLCPANASIDVTPHLEEKMEMIRSYRTQKEPYDYAAFSARLGAVRAFQAALRPGRDGAAESMLALPNRDYCAIVRSLYGEPGALKGI